MGGDCVSVESSAIHELLATEQAVLAVAKVNRTIAAV